MNELQQLLLAAATAPAERVERAILVLLGRDAPADELARLMPREEVCRTLGVCSRTLRRWGVPACRRIGGRTYYDRRRVAEYMGKGASHDG